MADIVAIAGIIATPLLGLAAYRYQNRIAYSVTSIGIRPDDDDDQINVKSSYGDIYAERLTIKSFGIRSLEKVELHFGFPTKPVAIKVEKSSTLSKNAIKIVWLDKVLSIIIPTLPAGEEIEIELLRVGHFEFENDRFKSTGGKYKIVRLIHEQRRREASFFIAFLIIIAALQLAIAYSQLSAPAPATDGATAPKLK